MKKLIINNTILFIFIMAYIFSFKFVFGDINILIAVMSITGLLMYLGRDLTGDIKRNSIGIIGFYILIGISSFISASHIWIAIPLNFLVVFLISYSFGHVLKSPMYIPFTLLYLFLLAYPVTISAMPLRLLALIIGAISIILPQFLINKNKIEKSGTKIFSNLIDLLSNKVILLEDGQATTEINSNIEKLCLTLKNIIYDKKSKHFYITSNGQHRLDLLVAIEKINLLLDKSSVKTNIELIIHVKSVIKILKLSIEKYEKENFDLYIESLKTTYADSINIDNLQFLSAVILLNDSLDLINKPHIIKQTPNIIKNDIYGLKNIKFNSIKLTYSIRVALAVSIACFIMQYFDLYQGRWIMYTVVSLTSPILEMTKSKTKDRIIATIIGAILIAIIFSLVKNMTIRGILVIIAGYANMYCITYRQKMISVTSSAIGAAILIGGPISGFSSISSSPLILSLERVVLILIGAGIALLINSFLFKYDSIKANANLTEVSDNLIKDLISNLDIILEKDKLNNYINTIYILISQIDSTIKNNIVVSTKLNLDNNYLIRHNYKLSFITTAYELNKLLDTYNISTTDKEYFEKVILKLKNNEFNSKTKLNYLKEIDNIDKKLILISLIELNDTSRKILKNN
ncbi:FUSC family protein [uncultured Clostridium sp.]|uniref:FUSC family protein n=1 Tax=uncultured Clostridium sp. TaxID=59620 RepID=UPI0026323ACF|nr:FUSC family protein [uncultured Clostridium sp.]